MVYLSLTTASLSGGWVPERFWSFHHWQPASRWRLHRWLAKPDKTAMSPHALEQTSTRHIDKQWKVEGKGRRMGEGAKKTAKHSTQNVEVEVVGKSKGTLCDDKQNRS